MDFFTPSSWTATAIFWRGGSITPEGRSEIEAGEEMCGEAVANAIIIAAHKLSDKPSEWFEHFLKQGLHIGMGGNGRIDA